MSHELSKSLLRKTLEKLAQKGTYVKERDQKTGATVYVHKNEVKTEKAKQETPPAQPAPE